MPKTLSIRIILIERHVVVREGIAKLLESEPDLTVCAGVSDGAAALQAIAQFKPQLVILGTTLKGGNGLELIRLIAAQYPALPLLVLSGQDELVYGEVALRSGAMGYVMKDEPFEKLLAAVRRVLSNQMFLSDAVTAQMVRQRVRPKAGSRISPAEVLNDRELQVFQLISDWKRTNEIAKELHLSPKTIEYHLGKIKDKLHVKTARDLLHLATAQPALSKLSIGTSSGNGGKQQRNGSRKQTG